MSVIDTATSSASALVGQVTEVAGTLNDTATDLARDARDLLTDVSPYHKRRRTILGISARKLALVAVILALAAVARKHFGSDDAGVRDTGNDADSDSNEALDLTDRRADVGERVK